MNTQPKDDPEIEMSHMYSINARDTLDELIRSERIKAEWLAKVTGISPQLLSKYRTGGAPLPFHVAALIDNALGQTVFYDLFASMVGRAS